MLEIIISYLAAIAGVLLALAHIPQAYKIYKRKSSHDVSLTTYIILFLGMLIWFVYGMTISQWPLIISSALSLVTMGSVLFLGLKFRD